MKNKIKIAVIGCGNMAQAILRGMTSVASKAVLKANGDVFIITVSDRNESKLMPFKSECDVTLDNAVAVSGADYIIIAVKPVDARAALSGLNLKDKIVISVMAGFDIDRIKSMTGATRIVRVMPNINARIGESMSAYASVGLNEEQERVVCEILGSFGRFERVNESDFDVVTGLSGCAPAFIFMAIKAFIDVGVAHGLSEELSRQLAIQTFYGSALNAEATEDLNALVSSVCSEGGATFEGVKYLKDNNFCGVFGGAIEKSISRAAELRSVSDSL